MTTQLSILGGAGSKVKGQAMAIMDGEGPGGANLVFYDRKLENMWQKRTEQEQERVSKTGGLHTALVLRMAHRKWKEIKQQPSMLPGPAVPGSCLVSFHFLWAILSTSTVHF